MKKVNELKNIRSVSEDELNKLFRERTEGLRAFRFGLAGSKVRNVKEGKTLRRQRARIATELTERKRKKLSV